MPTLPTRRVPEPYKPGALTVNERRMLVRTWIGAGVAGVALFSLAAVVALVAYLAIVHRSPEYIESATRPLQPFLLPTIGGVVGYALGSERDR